MMMQHICQCFIKLKVYVDEEVTFSQLKDLIYKIVYALFGQNVELDLGPRIFHLLSHLPKLIFSQKKENGLKYLVVEL